MGSQEQQPIWKIDVLTTLAQGERLCAMAVDAHRLHTAYMPPKSVFEKKKGQRLLLR